MKLNIQSEYKPYLRVGTCSWKYDSWKGLYYEEAKKYRPDEYLSDYAKHLNSVEVDQWFWSLFPNSLRLPEARAVKAYAESVPDDFIFTVKAPNSLTLTHFYAKQPKHYADFAGNTNIHFLDNDLLYRFLERLSPMGKKLGPISIAFMISSLRPRRIFSMLLSREIQTTYPMPCLNSSRSMASAMSILRVIICHISARFLKSTNRRRLIFQ
jgi:uncharacterized protein YecE (DUF72 family)